jgi:hypothetical protein
MALLALLGHSAFAPGMALHAPEETFDRSPRIDERRTVLSKKVRP